MIINGIYEFRDKDGNEIEPTKAQLLTFISDVLQKRDDEIKELKKAFELACQEIVDHVGNCPYDAKNLEFPPEEWCDEHCYDGERNPLMCWDVYLLGKAREELQEDSLLGSLIYNKEHDS